MIKKAKSAISIRITALSLAVAGALMFMTMDTYAADDTDPTTPADITFEAGELELYSAPEISFGIVEISGVKEFYDATEVSDPIEVNDLRGSGAGWSLTAALSNFATEEGDNTLTGASLTISSTTVKPEDSDNKSAVPVANQEITLAAGGGAAQVFSAAANTGLGDWMSEWAPENIKLTVLGGTALADEYMATITWTLQNTPA